MTILKHEIQKRIFLLAILAMVFVSPCYAADGDPVREGKPITGTLNIGKLAMTPSATTASPTTYADDAAIVVSFSVVRVEGNGGAVTLDTDPAVADGTADGQIVYIQGCDDTNTVTIADACNTQLAGAASAVLGEGDILTLLWDTGGSLWREVSRSDN